MHLSVVATSRNDDHGGQLTERMQWFVDGLAAQCERHGMRAELLLVEWNPPADRPSLSQALAWPRTSWCDSRIVTVSAQVHAGFPNADKIRLYQMIAKNVGIRRARGRFVLATNVDILFSDEAMRYMRDRLQPGFVYLADRVDVPAELPKGDFGDVLSYCRRNALRINGGSLTVQRGPHGWRAMDRVKSSLGPRLAFMVDVGEKVIALGGKAAANPRWAMRRMLGHGRTAGAGSRARRASVPLALVRGAARIARLTGGAVAAELRAPYVYTNACGDFTLMARDDWFRVRAYAEWPMFSWHLDGLLVYQALGGGMPIRRLPAGAPVFHIEHQGGYAPERAGEMFERLRNRGIPFLTSEELRRLRDELAAGSRDPCLNAESWGLADVPLPEAEP